MSTLFVSLKGQPIHKGHCFLIENMLNDYKKGDDIIIGIVNPFPLEDLDLSKNRKPENFHPAKNPLSYYERAYLLKSYLVSLFDKYDKKMLSSIIISPYFVPTIHKKSLMYNYLDIKNDSIEYISNKDEFELGKEKELNDIGVSVKFINGLKDKYGEYYSADSIRDKICNDIDTKENFSPVIFDIMQEKNLFNLIKYRVSERLCTQA